MPYIYLSKVNLNSKIYDVYDNKIVLSNVLDEVIKNIDRGGIYEKDTVTRYEDRLGIERKKNTTDKYLFNGLEKNSEEKIVIGDLVRVYPRYTEEFDMEQKESNLVEREESTRIHFYFDVENELIAFCTRNKFGYNQFNEAFKNLLNINIKEYGFEVFLKKDKSKVEEGINKFRRVDKVIATIIPPNANNDEVDDLIEDSSGLKSANIKKAKYEYESSPQDNDGLDMQAQIMRSIVKSVSNGYGDMNVHGRTDEGTNEVFRSNKEAAITGYIEEDSDEDEFRSISKKLINKFVIKKLL